LKCPNCNYNIESLIDNKSCPNCFYRFSENTIDKINFYKDLKYNLMGIELTQKYFSEQIDKIKTQLDKIESDAYNSTEFTELREGKLKEKQQEININSQEAIKEIPQIKKEPSISEKISKINWELLLGFNGLLILGVISVITGVGFFIRKAFVSGLLGPAGKVSIIYLGAVLSLGAGNFFKKKNIPEFGAAIAGMGIALLYYATYSAYANYHIFDQTVTFLLMIIITAFSVFISVIENNKWLAVLGLIGGFSTPFMIGSGDSRNIILYSYITILNIGLLAIAFNRKWHILNNLGFIATYTLYITTFKVTDFWTSVIFVNIFFLVYSITPLAYYIFKSRKENISNSILVFLNSLISLVINYDLIYINRYPIEYLSVITILYTLVFAFMANFLYRKGRGDEQAFVFAIGKSALFLSITIPIIFSGSVITVFWSAENVALVWISDKLKNKKLLYGSFIILLISVFKFFFVDYNEVFGVEEGLYISEGYDYKLISRLFASGFLTLAYYQFLNVYRKNQFKNNITFATFGFGWILSLFTILNVEVSSLFYSYFNDMRFVALSILWTIFAVSLMYFGLRLNYKILRQVAIGLFGLTIAKVFFFDIAELSASYKFISFIILGLVLIFASYLYRQFKDQLVEAIGVENNKDEISKYS